MRLARAVAFLALPRATCTEVPAAAAVVDGVNASSSQEGPEKLWHILPPELQHSLSGVLAHHGSAKNFEDPDVDAFMSNLLHDELDAQWKKELADEEKIAKEAEEFAKVQDEKRKAEHEKSMRELEVARKARAAEMEAARTQREAEQKRMQDEAKRAHDEMVKKNEEFMQRSKERREKSQKRRAEMEERHAQNWQRASSLLQQVHTELEMATDGWRDAPFWDDFFRTSSAATRFAQLGFSHIEPAFRASSVLPDHRVLVLEPRGATLADRLAGEIRSAQAPRAEASAYGAESDEGRDVVVEVGLLDAMAMGGAGQGSETSKLDALKSASARLAKLVRPGGTWISISAVPPTLRVPLLGRLAGGAFALPSDKEDAAAGTHAVVLPAPAVSGKAKAGLRGAAQVADMLLYGSEDVHIWAYRMHRGDDSADMSEGANASSQDGILDMIRQQRPSTRDDL